MTRLLLAIVALLCVVPGTILADGPLNLALVPSVQIVSETESVTAFRLGIWSRNANTTGLDLGLVAQNTGSLTGVQWTAAGVVEGDFTGWQNNWLASVAEGNMQGLQMGIYTKSGGGSSGVQFGFVNTSDDFSGFQLGFVNITEIMRSGLQIGIVNVIKSKENLKLFPIVNWSF